MKALILAILLSLSCNFTSHSLYINPAVVVDDGHEDNIVLVEDSDGDIWGFYSPDSYAVGDAVVLLMSDSGTPDTTLDDEILHCFSFPVPFSPA